MKTFLMIIILMCGGGKSCFADWSLNPGMWGGVPYHCNDLLINSSLLPSTGADSPVKGMTFTYPGYYGDSISVYVSSDGTDAGFGRSCPSNLIPMSAGSFLFTMRDGQRASGAVSALLSKCWTNGWYRDYLSITGICVSPAGALN